VEDVEMPQHVGEGIVDLVRDARRERTDRRHAIGHEVLVLCGRDRSDNRLTESQDVVILVVLVLFLFYHINHIIHSMKFTDHFFKIITHRILLLLIPAKLL
jgi:hypothetical protein